MAEQDTETDPEDASSEGDEDEALEVELVGLPGNESELDGGEADLGNEVLLEKAVAKAESATRLAKREKRGALSKSDPLAAYMRDVSRYDLLSADEEHALAVSFAEDGDLDAAKKLVTSNLRLVVKIAYDYRKAYKNLLDLIQEGNIGLMQAVKKFDPYKGVKLSTYGAWWIRAYMLRYILNTHRMVKLGTTQAQRKLFFNLKKEKARLSALGIEPTPELIAERLNVKTEEVVQMDRRMAAGDASLDAPVGGDDGKTVARIELLSSPGALIDDSLADQELGDLLTQKIHEFGSTLTGKEKDIFQKRLVAEDPQTLQTLGDSFGVSRERVRQIEKRLVGKLKTYLNSNVSADVLDVYEA